MTAVPSIKFRAAAAGMLVALLAACGGGGGSAGWQPPPNVAVTQGNQDDVTRAGLAGMQTGVLGGSLGIAGSGGASPLAAVGSTIRRALSGGAGVLSSARKRAARVYPDDGACAVSGTYSGTVNDRDDSLSLTVGDTISVTLTNCVEVLGVELNGKMAFTYTQLSTAPVAVGANVETENLSVNESQTGYLASLTGGFRFTYSEPAASTGVTRMIVPDHLVMRVRSASLDDTITLMDGYNVLSTYYAGAPARTETTSEGPVASANAGGFVRITTTAALVQFHNGTDDYPHAGQIIAAGVTGKLRVTVLSSTQVRIELDENGDNIYEQSKTVLWASLL